MRRKFYFFILSIGLVTGCAVPRPQVPRIGKVEFGKSIWSEGQRHAQVLFQDGGQSIAVAGGSFWTFGDSFIGQPEPGQMPTKSSKISGARPTTIAFLPAGRTNLPPQLDYFTDSAGVAVFSFGFLPGETAKGNRIWPLDGITVGSRIYLYYTLIRVTDGPGPWNFKGVGAGLGVATKAGEPFVRLQPQGQWRFPITPSQVVREGDELFLFEVSENPKGLIMGRVSVKEIENPAAYEFFTTNGWSHDRMGVKVILKEAYGQVSIARLPGRDGYLMATSSDFFHPQEIQFRESSRFEGPWSEPVRVAVPKFPGKVTNLIYCTFLHPELADEASGRMVVTYCRILAGDWELSNPERMAFTVGR